MRARAFSALARRRERAVLDPIQRLRCRAMRGQLIGSPRRLESLHEIAGRDDRHAAPAHGLGRSRVQPRQIRNRAVGRILHRHRRDAVEQARQRRFELLAPGVHRLRAGQGIEVVALDGVHHAARLPRRRDQVIPPAGRHVAAAIEPRNGRRNRVRAVKVVEQPAIQAVGAKRPLDGGHIERHGVSILQYRRSLCKSRPVISDAGPASKVGEVWTGGFL